MKGKCTNCVTIKNATTITQHVCLFLRINVCITNCFPIRTTSNMDIPSPADIRTPSAHPPHPQSLPYLKYIGCCLQHTASKLTGDFRYSTLLLLKGDDICHFYSDSSRCAKQYRNTNEACRQTKQYRNTNEACRQTKQYRNTK